jgi:hypothetical protein
MITLDHDHCLIIYHRPSGLQFQHVSLQPHDAPLQVEERDLGHPELAAFAIPHRELRVGGEALCRQRIAELEGRTVLPEHADRCCVYDHAGEVIAVHRRIPGFALCAPRAHEGEAGFVQHTHGDIGDRHEGGVIKRRYVACDKTTGEVIEDGWLEPSDVHPTAPDHFYLASTTHAVGQRVPKIR